MSSHITWPHLTCSSCSHLHVPELSGYLKHAWDLAIVYVAS